MIGVVNNKQATGYSVGQNIYIRTKDVPDLWVYGTMSVNKPYTYTSDSNFINELNEKTIVQVGHFMLAMLETQKVDLTEYAKIPDVNTSLLKKIDKPDATTYARALMQKADSTLVWQQVANTPAPYTIVLREDGGRVKTGNPADGTDATNKNYVDGMVSNKMPFPTNVSADKAWDFAVCYNPSAKTTTGYTISTASEDGTSAPAASAVIRANKNRQVGTADPTGDHHCTNKKYVDGKIGDIDTVLDEILEIQEAYLGGTGIDKVLSTNDYTNQDKAKVNTLIINGNGLLFLANDGTYKNASSTMMPIPTNSTKDQEYVVTYNPAKNISSVNTLVKASASGVEPPYQLSFVRVNESSQLTTADPTGDYHCANKKYVDSGLSSKVEKIPGSENNRDVYANIKGVETVIPVQTSYSNARNGVIAVYKDKEAQANNPTPDALLTCDPMYDYHCAPKKYVDEQFTNKEEEWTFVLEDGTTVSKKVVITNKVAQ